MNIFEQLKEKSTPKNVKQFVLHIKTDQPIDVVENENVKEYGEDGEIEADYGEDSIEETTSVKPVLEFIDKRHESHIERTLILQRIRGFKEKLEEQEPMKSPSLEPTTPSPKIDLQEEKEGDIGTSDEEEAVSPVPAPIIKQKKRKLKIVDPSVFNKKGDDDDKIIIPPIDMEVRDTVFKTPRKRKTAVVLPIAHGNFNIKNIDKKLPRKRNKIVYKSSSYYMNNRKLFIEKIDKK